MAHCTTFGLLNGRKQGGSWRDEAIDMTSDSQASGIVHMPLDAGDPQQVRLCVQSKLFQDEEYFGGFHIHDEEGTEQLIAEQKV